MSARQALPRKRAANKVMGALRASVCLILLLNACTPQKAYHGINIGGTSLAGTFPCSFGRVFSFSLALSCRRDFSS